MHIELIESLRCPSPHGLTWLVAQTAEIRQRHVTVGTLGCPECGARFPIQQGVLDLRLDRGERPAPREESPMSVEETTRLAALLGLGGEAGLVVLVGDRARAAADIAAMIDGVRVLAINPDAEDHRPPVSVMRTDGRMQLRDGSARAIALDAAHATAAIIASAVAALAPRARLVAPASAPQADELREIARDDRDWVAERIPVPVVVPLRRG